MMYEYKVLMYWCSFMRNRWNWKWWLGPAAAHSMANHSHSVKNPVHGILSTRHQRLPFHLIDSCTTQTVVSYWTAFPITHCTDHPTVIITRCTDYTAVPNHTLTWEPLHTPYKRHSFLFTHHPVLFCVMHSLSVSCLTEPFCVLFSSCTV